MGERIVLYVEDTPDDQFLFRKAAQLAPVQFAIHTVSNGEEAIDYLTGKATFANRAAFPFPNLILLDLKMPVADGFDLLRWIREQPAFKNLPVIIFTSSYQHADVTRGYAEGANAFLTKPSLLDDLVAIAQGLDQCLTPRGVDIRPLSVLAQFKRA